MQYYSDTFNVNSTIIIGLSGGGASALQFALRHFGALPRADNDIGG